MECKDCTYFSNAYGGSCFGWTDISDTKACDNANNCPQFRVREKEPNYTPNITEEYSEYDNMMLEVFMIVPKGGIQMEFGAVSVVLCRAKDVSMKIQQRRIHNESR